MYCYVLCCVVCVVMEIEEEKKQAVIDKENTLKALAEHKAIEESERLAAVAKAKEFQGQLKGQIDFRYKYTTHRCTNQRFRGHI